MYRKANGKTFYTRVTASTGERRVCSTGTTLRATAKHMEDWVSALRGRHDMHGVLDAIVAKRIDLSEAYRLGEASNGASPSSHFL